MNRLLESSRYLIVIAVLFSLLASMAAFVWGAVKTVATIANLIASSGKDPLRQWHLSS
jgi:uncharacterized membrane protein YqhA